MGPLPNKLADGSGIVNASCGNNRIKPRFQKLAPLVRGVSTDQIISLSVCGIVAITMILGFFLQRLSSELSDGEWWAVLVVIVLVLVLVILYGLIAIHEEVVTEQRYKMPCVPLLPVLSIVVNTILMTTLQTLTWMRLLIWLAIGLTGYFVYGIQHSKLNKKQTAVDRSPSTVSNETQLRSHI